MEDMILATDVSRNKDFMTQFEVSVYTITVELCDKESICCSFLCNKALTALYS